MDFLISNSGDLIVKNDKLETCKEEMIKVQSAYCICKSISNDWFIDKLGANLEQLIGKSIDRNTIELGKKLIIMSLSDIYDESNIYIESKIEKNILTNIVYLKTKDGFSSNKFNITIDLLGYLEKTKMVGDNN